MPLNKAMNLLGALGAALVDLETGTCMAVAGNGENDDVSLAAIVNARTLRAQFRLVQERKSDEKIEDLLITFDSTYHLIRPIQNGSAVPSAFLFLIMSRSLANLALTRRKLAELEEEVAQKLEVDRRLAEIRAASRPPAEKKDELPAFMREDVVMRLLGISSEDRPRRNDREDR